MSSTASATKDVKTKPMVKPELPRDATVLVVEDNVSNFVLIARMLGYMGIHCEWKTSGYEVVEYADALPRIDLILMDIRLPYEDGYGALKKIRASARLIHLESPILSDQELEALRRIEDGTYGICLACGTRISGARLAAVPEAERCSGCINPH